MKILIWAAVAAAAFLLGIRYVERHSIYFPMKEVTRAPESAGIAYEDVYFRASDGKRLNGWFIPREGAKYTILFCHGNAGNIGHRMEKIAILRSLGLDIFIFDYRGYGKSDGAPNEKGLYNDGRGAYDYLVNQRKIPEKGIIIYGESIGSAVAIELASGLSSLDRLGTNPELLSKGSERPAALIIEEAFTSAREMASMAFPFMPSAVFSSRFDSLSKIAGPDCPVLVIHSRDDEIVPFSMGKKLFGAAREPKRFVELKGGHNTAFLESESAYRQGIKSFLDSLKR